MLFGHFCRIKFFFFLPLLAFFVTYLLLSLSLFYQFAALPIFSFITHFLCILVAFWPFQSHFLFFFLPLMDHFCYRLFFFKLNINFMSTFMLPLAVFTIFHCFLSLVKPVFAYLWVLQNSSQLFIPFLQLFLVEIPVLEINVSKWSNLTRNASWVLKELIQVGSYRWGSKGACPSCFSVKTGSVEGGRWLAERPGSWRYVTAVSVESERRN